MICLRNTRLFEETGICVCLVAIVKNEIHIISELFDSMLLYVNCYFIADTGSTDETKSFIIQWTEEHQLPGQVVDIPWVHFGQARTELMRQCSLWANKTINHITYAFMMDADDIVVGPLSLQPLARLCDAYVLQLKSGRSPYKRKQIFKLSTNNTWSYKGFVHEHPVTSNPVSVSEVISGEYYIDSRRLGDRNKDQHAKHTRDAALMLEELKLEPNNTRNHFYLALAYFYIQDWDRAIPWFEKRLQARHFWEEEWWSTLKLAECYRKRNREGDVDVAKAVLWDAVSRYADRAEQSYDLSSMFEKERNFGEALRIARYGHRIAKPTNNNLWILEDVYSYWMPWQHFRLTWKAREYAELLAVSQTLSVEHFAKNRHEVNYYVCKSVKRLAMTQHFIDYPLHDPEFVLPPTHVGHVLTASARFLTRFASDTWQSLPAISSFACSGGGFW